MSILQMIMMRFLANGRATCQKGWTEAGHGKRIKVQGWAMAFLLQNGDLGGIKDGAGITQYDVFPGGTVNAKQKDIARVQGLLGEWLTYHAERHPTETLNNAMLEAILRLILSKRGWMLERGDERFPFEPSLASISGPVMEAYRFTHKTFREAWIGGDERRRSETLFHSGIVILEHLKCYPDITIAARHFGIAETKQDAITLAMKQIMIHWFDDYSANQPDDKIYAGAMALVNAGPLH